MKRYAFRITVLGMLVALGLLAIAHAQRTDSTAPPPDDNAANPLRDRDSQPIAPQGPPTPEAIAPVPGAPGDLKLGDNPLRGRRVTSDGSVRPASAEEPQGQAPLRIRLVADGQPVNGNAGYPSGSQGKSAGEPQLMPATADHYAVPAQQTNGQDSVPGPRPPLRSGAIPSGPRLDPPDPRYNYLPGSIREAVPEDNLEGNTAAADGTGQPGGKQLEGPQSPRVTVQKIAPPEIQVGKPEKLRVVIRNSGTEAASGVEIHDQVPRGTRLLGTSPPAAQGPRGELVWSLGTIKPGEGTSVEMQVMPTEEGEVGSVATVHFQTEATARSIVTRPKLAVVTTGGERVLVGDETTLTFTVSNPGSGVATGVVLVEHIPATLKHPGGSELEYPVGDLKPGQSRQMKLPLKAVQAGAATNVITARADANLRAENRFNVEVTAPQLDVAMTGPKRRYLEREATYQFSVANPGTAPAEKVELVAYLPQGLKFVNADNFGRYDAAARSVSWRMDQLPVNEHHSVELVTLPVESGQFSIKVRGAAQRGLSTEKEQPVMVEGLASVVFHLSHTKDPLEIGGETTYEITLVNQGSKESSNLQVSIFLPAELKPLAADGPTRYTIENNKVVFESLPQLAPKSMAAFHVRAQGVRAGDLRVRCQLMTDEMQRPVLQEESTRVFADE